MVMVTTPVIRQACSILDRLFSNVKQTEFRCTGIRYLLLYVDIRSGTVEQTWGRRYLQAYRPDMTEEEGIQLMKACVKELKTRFFVQYPKFIVKIVDAVCDDGVAW